LHLAASCFRYLINNLRKIVRAVRELFAIRSPQNVSFLSRYANP
jgi:hypothetical protein